MTVSIWSEIFMNYVTNACQTCDRNIKQLKTVKDVSQKAPALENVSHLNFLIAIFEVFSVDR